MQYSNFIMKNNVHATLSTALSSVATTIQLTTGQGARFGTEFPQIATLESFDDTGKVVKREIVQITARNGDDLTVVRAFAPCPANDDANSQSQSSVSFSADDQISLYIPKEIFDGIKKSLNDIYDNGTNNMRTDIVSGLQVEVNPGSVLVGSAYYDFAGGTITLTDNATNYLEIDEDGNLANNTTGRNDENTKLAIITTFGGSVTKIQDWRLGTVGGKIGGVNIHDLTEKASLSPDDELIISDSENIRQNKKIKASGLLGVGNSLAGEDINRGDFLYVEGMGNVDGFDGVGYNTDVQKLAIQIIGNGENFDNIKLYLAKVGTPTNDLSIRIETDNNGEPSGTLVDANATGIVAPGDLTTTLTQTIITFGGTINIPEGEVCFIVLDFGTYDSANYYQIGGTIQKSLFITKQYNGLGWNDWTDYNNTRDIANNINLGKTYRFGNNNYQVDWIRISPDGKTIFVRQSNNSTVFSYTLTTPRDITTAVSTGYSVNPGQNTNGFYVNKKGTKLFVLCNNYTVYGYNLTTAWDLSTATQVSTYNLGGSTQYYGLTFSENGKYMYVVLSQTLIQYTLTTPRDITTANLTNTQGITVRQSAYSIDINSDGTIFFVSGVNYMTTYTLTTPRDITTVNQKDDVAINGMRGASIDWVGQYLFVSRDAMYVDTYSIGTMFGFQTQKNIDCNGIELVLIGKACAVELNTLPIVPMSAVANFDTGNKVTYNLLQDNSKSGLTIGQKYFLSDTPGKIQTTPGTNEFEVGIAIEPTILKLKQTY